MARNNRQSKILEIISTNEVETQEELVASLKAAGFDVTQATISRDIKELGLIKIMTDSKKYKYATVNSSVQSVSSKVMSIAKECIISVKCATNLVVVRVMKGSAQMVGDIIDGLSLAQVMGITYGSDTVLVVAMDVDDAYYVKDKLLELLK